MLTFSYKDLGDHKDFRHYFAPRLDRRVEDRVGATEETFEWCEARYGPYEEKPGDAGRWWAHNGFFWFRRTNDAFEFRMRWG